MATTRSDGYVVTATDWNAVHSRLTDDGATYSGTVTGAFAGTTLGVSGAATFNAGVTFSGNNVPRVVANSGSESLRFLGRSSDSVSALTFRDTTDTTEYGRIQTASTGMTYATGSTSRTHTFTGGRVNSNAVQPGFLARNTADDTGATNDAVIDFDAEVFDTGAVFATDTFTAPVTGRYWLAASVMIANASGGAVDVGAFVRTSGASGGYWIGYESGVPNGAQRLFSGGVVVDMDAGHTATVRLYTTAAVTVRGDGTGMAFTYFSGRLLI